TCPIPQGGVSHWPTSYSHRTNLIYASGIDGCSTASTMVEQPTPGGLWAVNMSGDIAFKRQTPFPSYGGTLSTAGGLVFSSTVDGEVTALNDETLETLWRINLGGAIEAPPMTYEVGGKQYVAIAVGTDKINRGGGYLAKGDDPNAAF